MAKTIPAPTEDTFVQLNARVPLYLRRGMRTYCNQRKIKVENFVQEALKARLNGHANGHAAPAAKGECLRPGCKVKAHARGLCMACYLVANTLVRKKQTTWERLEKAGRVAHVPTPTELRRAWLLGQ